MKVRTGLFVVAAVLGGALALPAIAADDCLGTPGPDRLTVKVSGVRAAKGEVAVTLYPDVPKRFLAPKGKLLRARVTAAAPVSTACFYLPGPGAYAVAVYHDVNGDHDFNRDIFGMPSEGFGFSNDPPTKVGLPSFEAARFRVRAGHTTLPIKMRYAR